MSVPIFHRTQLAEKIVDRVLSPKGLSGLFISAPRRQGKSTLITEDIIPYLKEQDAEVIYVDLWSDRSRDPGDLISDAVRKHLRDHEGFIMRTARRNGLEKVSVGGLEFDISKVGVGTGIVFSEAFAELSIATKKKIVLVIDEVQHATTTEAGVNAMFALKAARDKLNGSEYAGFRLIATGSNRDKLNLLVQGNDQAFMGAVMMDLDPLGEDYIKWEMDYFEGEFKPSHEILKEVFAGGGFKPETFRKVLDDLSWNFNVTCDNVDETIRQGLAAVLHDAQLNFMQQVRGLPPLQAAVLTVMALEDRQYAPFRPHTVEMYATECKRLSKDKINIDDSAIQYALEALRTKTLIWKSSRGVYSIEDVQHGAWLREDYQAPAPDPLPQPESILEVATPVARRRRPGP